jgi:putative ABC transport system substrate-binding protein
MTAVAHPIAGRLGSNATPSELGCTYQLRGLSMRRREFIAGLGSAAVWPLKVWAQQGDRVRRIGVLMAGDEHDPVQKALVSAFTQALAGLGWSNLRMDVRWPGGDINRIRALAHELVGLQSDIIVANSTPATVALQHETRTIPIVFMGLFDPVASGIVARLDRPGENITGFVAYEATLGGKWLELLSEIAPGLKRAAILFNPDLAPVSAYTPSLETAARSLKVDPIITPVRNDVEIEGAIRKLGSEPGACSTTGRRQTIGPPPTISIAFYAARSQAISRFSFR